MPILGSHVGMSGKDMMLGSVKEALSYDADTFMTVSHILSFFRLADVIFTHNLL